MSDVRALPIGTRRVTTDDTITVRSPYDGHEIGVVPACGSPEVDAGVLAAETVRRAAPLPAWQRAEILDRAARLLGERAEEFARTIAEEAAKPIKTARVEARRAVSTFTFAALEARRLTGEMVPMEASDVGAGKLAFTLRVPIGVVGAISPFNFPLNLVAHKVAPAIAAGCPVVLKPASQTPLSAIALAELLLDECDLPPGWLNVVTGGGGTVGNAIVDHPGIAMITFTGSPEVGWGIRSRAPRKKVGLELGNNAPVILEPDADFETAARKISVAGFSHAGQSCISTQRVLVHETIAEKFLSELVPLVEALAVGDPLDDSTDVSALISEPERDRVAAWIAEATANGARVACGGEIRDGVLTPTVLTDVRPDMKVCSQEVFGPVVAVQTYRDVDDALRLANDTRYGLQAAIFTGDLATALRAARELDFGGVLVNEVPTFRADQMPYGGVRDSGNTREGPRYAVEEMTETRLVVLQGDERNREVSPLPVTLDGAAALVTGAASGIGRATATRFAAEGARVCVVDLDEAAGRAVAEELGGAFVRADVGDPAQTDAAFAHCVRELGGVDVAYLNAGIAVGTPDITELTDATYRRIMGPNVDGVVFGARAAARLMRDRGGAIVATSSLAGLVGFSPDPVYTLTKHAVIGLVRALAPNLEQLGITINAVCPGMTDTAIIGADAKARLRAADFPLIAPEEIAGAVVAAVTGGDTGQAWVCQAGREPIRYRFHDVPGPRATGARGRVPPGVREAAGSGEPS